MRARWGKKALPSQIDDAVEQLARLVGLDRVLGTKVGNAYVRGISGGERRRVSLAEALATCPRSVHRRDDIRGYSGTDLCL